MAKRLVSSYPSLVAEWHPTKNGALRPNDVTHGSGRVVWWSCPKGHEYDSMIKGRARDGRGCPYCAGKRIAREDSLATKFPKIAKEWHPTKNGQVIPSTIAPRSSKKAWWLCPKGHEYHSVVSGRTGQSFSGCPYCSRKRVGKDNNLAVRFPKIAKEWHPKKNESLTPRDLTYGSTKKVWWLCPKGHEYDMPVGRRTAHNPQGCPYCSGRRVGKDNNLAIKFPRIAKEWHPKNNGTLTARDVTIGSNRKVWWLCSKGHEYHISIVGRTDKRRKSGCPYCAGLRVSNDNCLQARYPEIAKEWHPAKNGTLVPRDFMPGTKVKVWWLCPKGHDYEMVVHSRTGKRKQKCPYCSGNRVGPDNNLATKFPNIAREWHPTKNGTLTPKDVSYGSGKKAWWLCSNGHEFFTSMSVRTRPPGGSRCPSCSNQSSAPEMRILAESRGLFDEVISRYKLSRTEIDIYFPQFKVGIEYDGSYYHSDRQALDLEKSKKLKAKGVFLLRVRKHPLEKIFPDDVIVKKEDLSKNDVNRIFSAFSKHLNAKTQKRIAKYLRAKSFQNEQLFKQYLSYFPSPLPEHALSTTHSHLSDDWDYKKNHPLTPQNFTAGSHRNAWWQCPEGHSYETQIHLRGKKNKPQGCPYCSGHRVSEQNNLQANYPDIAKEWHPAKNRKLKPDSVTPASHKKVWWLCPKGHEYDMAVMNRTGKKPQACPYCSSRRIGTDNNLAVTHPNIAKEWHPTKNGTVTPRDIMSGTNKTVWWLCAKNHAYQTPPHSRTNKTNPTGCPDCAGQKVGHDNNLAVKFPKIAKEWHLTKNGTLTPQDVLPSNSRKKVWWLCPKGHEYDMPVGRRTHKDRIQHGCPYCSGQRIGADNNLEVMFPQIANEWHPTKNGKFTPRDVAPHSSRKKVWWLCPNGHDYDMPVANRTDKRPQGCPYCSGHRVGKDNNLAVKHPIIAKEWHPTKNGILGPQDIVPGTKVKVWWLCPKKHEYETSPGSRTRRNKSTGCPYCSNRRVGKDNHLFAKFPDVANEWHPTKNGTLTPKDVSYGSNKKVWWRCQKEHEYETTPQSRTRTGKRKPAGCPYCSSHRVSKGNNLLVKFPTISREWHPKKNERLTPDSVMPGSNKKVWWLCPNGHEYDMTVGSRTHKNRRKQACPYCSGRRAGKDNNLSTRFPDIAKQWHPSKNGDITAEQVTPYSHKDIWWLCTNGHEFHQAVYRRTHSRSKCPFC